ncbi:MAG: hypothetical protein ACYTGN_05755 [Planctomycetota bacterium]
MRQQQSTPASARQNRKLGADKPCSACGQPIYFGYKGPLDGVCGKCTDRLTARHQQVMARTVAVSSGKGGLGLVWVLLAFAAGAAAGAFARPFLPWF